MDESEVIVGRVVRAHGLRGELVIQPASAGSDVLFHVDAVVFEQGGKRQERTILRAREQGKAIALAVEGVGDRNAAEALVGSQLVIAKDELPPPEEGEFYVDQLMGLPVVSPSGEPLGKVVAFEDGGMQSWLVVEAGGKQSLVPFTEPLIKIDLEGGRIVLDAPEGLLNPEAAEEVREKS